MRIGNGLPFHIARAYGVARKPVSAGPTAPRQERTAGSAPARHPLVGGSVPQPVAFDSSQRRPRSVADSLPMYNRAADTVEAAVAVQLGRMIDATA